MGTGVLPGCTGSQTCATSYLYGGGPVGRRTDPPQSFNASCKRFPGLATAPVGRAAYAEPMPGDDYDPPSGSCADLDARAQELVAVALTMMTRHALGEDEGDSRESAGIVVDALRELGAREDLVPELRRLCGRLQRLWSVAASKT